MGTAVGTSAPGLCSGRFITFEGIDGSGKSTQARRLAEALGQRGHAVTLTREPGGSPGAEEIRALLLGGGAGRWSAETEILLFAAARRDHLERTIRPALSAGHVVVCDRYVDSTRAYQGADPERLALVNSLHSAAIACDPDVTFLCDIDPGKARERARARQAPPDRFETRGLAFQRDLRRRFLALASAEPARFIVVDASRPEQHVTEQVLSALDAADLLS